MDFSSIVKPVIEAFLIAVAAVGIIEYFKGIPWKKDPPKWVWVVASPVLCFGGAILLGAIPGSILIGALALTFAQIGYQTLIQGIEAAINSATGANIQPPKTP